MGRRSKSGYFLLGLKGFCMGAADVVPGVSGGTMAFILGIYEELIGAIKSVDLRAAGLLFRGRLIEAVESVQWRFLVSLGLGIFTAIFSLARIISWLLDNQPVLIWSFFFGLILASIVTVTRHFQRWSALNLIWVVLGGAAAYWLVGLVPVTTPNAPWFIFMSGAVAICAMILPGISGSFVLVLLGKYQYVLDAVNNRDFLTLFIVAAGAAVGLAAFSRVLNWLFSRYHDITIAVLCGLMIGSLRKVWPWKAVRSGLDGSGTAVMNVLPPAWGGETLLAAGLLLTGVAVVITLEWLARRSAS